MPKYLEKKHSYRKKVKKPSQKRKKLVSYKETFKLPLDINKYIVLSFSVSVIIISIIVCYKIFERNKVNNEGIKI